MVASSVAVTSCYDADSSLGSDFLPNSQELSMGKFDFWGLTEGGTSEADMILSTRLYRTARINSARLTTGAFGEQTDPTFGNRRTGFFSRYTPVYSVDDDDDDDEDYDNKGFGYRPFIDSVMLYITLSDYSGDTTKSRKYNIYEVLDLSFIENSADTLFNVDFNFETEAQGMLRSNPIFSFTFPDQDNEVYTNSGQVKMDYISADGYALLDRLMLEFDGSDPDLYNDGKYEDFVDMFKGLYIAPAAESYTDEGATFNLSLTGSGFGFYGRNRKWADPDFIADTIGMTYTFYDTAVTDYVDPIAITTVERDYAGTIFESTPIKYVNEDGTEQQSSADVATTSTVYVEGMGGIVTEIMLEKVLFQAYEAAIVAENEANSNEFTSLFFNTARLTMFIESENVEYDIPLVMTPTEAYNISNITSRLGLFSTLSTYYDSDYETELETAVDYNYAWEYTYSSVSDYDGNINRSLGCYVMNIPQQMQKMWTEYREALEEAGGDIDNIDWAAQTWNKLYLAPLATDLFSPRYTTAQGNWNGEIDSGAADVNNAPMRLQVTYTLIK